MASFCAMAPAAKSDRRARHVRKLLEAPSLASERVRSRAAAQRQALRTSEEANRAKDQALALVAHELRQELHTAVAAAALAEFGITTDSAKRAHAVLMRCLLGMSRLVDDLLEQSRMAFGKIELQRRPVKLAGLLDAAVQGVAPAAARKHQELRVEHAASDVWLRADPLRVGQIFNNLLTNAVRYTPERGRITLSVRLEGAIALVTIRDTGPGIPPDLLSHVFEPFVRGTTVEKGLGLGLPLALGLAELHGGTIEAQNSPEGGAQFTVKLPIAQPPR